MHVLFIYGEIVSTGKEQLIYSLLFMSIYQFLQFPTVELILYILTSFLSNFHLAKKFSFPLFKSELSFLSSSHHTNE